MVELLLENRAGISDSHVCCWVEQATEDSGNNPLRHACVLVCSTVWDTTICQTVVEQISRLESRSQENYLVKYSRRRENIYLRIFCKSTSLCWPKQ